MAKFDAATAVEALDFDFSKYGTKSKPGPVGTIPEPSSAQVKKFFKELRDITLEVQRRSVELEKLAAPPEVKDGKIIAEEDLVTDEEALETVTSMSEEEAQEWNERGLKAVIDVCGGAFTKADLERLPYRVQRAFMKWLGEQLRPEGQTPAMTG